jgi:hypothetical protein
VEVVCQIGFGRYDSSEEKVKDGQGREMTLYILADLKEDNYKLHLTKK